MRLKFLFPLYAAALAAPMALAIPAGAATASLPAPFTAPNVSGSTPWCPDFHADSGCNVDNQNETFGTRPFALANTTITGKNGYINLALDSSHGAAFNGQGQTNYHVGATIAEKINVQCNGSNVPVDWFAFWTDGAPGAQNSGEIDIFENTDQKATGGIHFGSGGSQHLGMSWPGNNCGVHTYAVIWTADPGGKVAFYKDGVWITKITSAQMGQPMITADQRVINDVSACTQSWCNPVTSSATYQVQAFSTSSVGPLTRAASLMAFHRPASQGFGVRYVVSMLNDHPYNKVRPFIGAYLFLEKSDLNFCLVSAGAGNQVKMEHSGCATFNAAASTATCGPGWAVNINQNNLALRATQAGSVDLSSESNRISDPAAAFSGGLGVDMTNCKLGGNAFMEADNNASGAHVWARNHSGDWRLNAYST